MAGLWRNKCGFTPLGLDPPANPSYIGSMQAPQYERWKKIGRTVGASIALHAVVAALLFVRLPLPQVDAPKEEVVDVQMVSPPEEPPPEEKAPEEKPAEEKPPEEKKQEKQDEAAKPPEEKPAPPPPPPPKPEEVKQTPPPSAPQKPPEDKQPAKGQSLPSLRPVVQFGEKDSGPRKSLDGDAAREGEVSPEPPKDEAGGKPAEADATVDAKKPSETKPPDPKTAEQKPPVQKNAEDKPKPPAGLAVPPQIAVPQLQAEATKSGQAGQTVAYPADTAVELTQEPDRQAADSPPAASPPAQPPVPQQKPSEQPATLTEAKKLFSQSDAGGAVAMTAMRGLPRNVRVGQLCTTELREQLKHSSGGYQPEILPSYGLSSGTVLDVRQAAFRASGTWYDVSFRCEIDPGATKIVSFAYQVGAPVPRSQWQKRGFPTY